MAAYEQYKDSGVKWLGEIPSHWDIDKIRYYFDEITELNLNRQSSNQLQFKFGTIIPKPDLSVDETVWHTISKYTVVKPNDIIINGLNLNYDLISHRVGRVRENGVITSAYVHIRPHSDISAKYYEYLFKAMDARKVFHGFGTGVRATLSYKELRHKPIVIPPIDEQEAIVAYLDRVTGEIDRAIEVHQQMIDALNERIQIIISNAVTKGLNPEAPLRDSGIDWLGQIPAHWEVRRMRYLVDITTGKRDTINRVDNGLYPFYVRSPHVERINTYTFDGEAVLMAGDGVGAGKVFHYANGKFDFHQRVYCFYNFKEILGKWLFFYLKTSFRYKIEEGGAKSTVDSVRLPWLKDFPITIPPKEEQKSIIEYVETNTKALIQQIENCKRMIDLLTERKQIIINQVVTGKEKVI